MNKKIIWGIVVIIIIALIVWATKSSGPQSPNAENPIKIGAVLSLTGFAAPWGENARDGIALAVKTINAKGGIDGRAVEVIVEDDHTDGKDAVSAWNKLVNIDGVDGVIGGIFDFNTQPLLPLAETSKRTLISPTNFRIEGNLELGPNSFVMLVNFKDIISHFREFLTQDSVEKLAVVHFQSAWGTEITKTLVSIMKDLNKPAIIEESYAELGNNDFRTTVAKLKDSGADTVFLDMLGNDTVNFLKRAKELNFKPKYITYVGSLDAFASESDKSLIEGIALVNWEVTSAEFALMYQGEFGKPALKSADKAFDAVYVLSEAIAKSDSPNLVSSYIQEHTFTTPNATIKFAADHTTETTPAEIQIVRDGQLVPWTK